MARSVEDIEEDIAAVRSARRTLIAGERIKDVWRDGRRLVFSEISLSALNDMLDDLKRELSEAQAESDGRPRRRAIGIAWRN